MKKKGYAEKRIKQGRSKYQTDFSILTLPRQKPVGIKKC